MASHDRPPTAAVPGEEAVGLDGSLAAGLVHGKVLARLVVVRAILADAAADVDPVEPRRLPIGKSIHEEEVQGRNTFSEKC